MEVDEDMDGILTQFHCLNTSDGDDLIGEFQRLVGPDASINAAGCAFWLDMFNWNIHAAIGAFYDWQTSGLPPENDKFDMTLCEDVTFADGESVSPGTRFHKTWRIRNSGSDQWLPGSCLRFVGGTCLGEQDRFVVEPIQPGQSVDLTVTLTSPSSPGLYQSQWRMASPTGSFFGDFVWILVQVEVGGILGVTQCLNRLSYATSRPPLLPPQDSLSPPSREEMAEESPMLTPPANPFNLNSWSPINETTPPPSSPLISEDPSTLFMSHPFYPPLSPSPSFSPISESPPNARFSVPEESPRLTCAATLVPPAIVLPPSPPPYPFATPSLEGFNVSPPPPSRGWRDAKSPTQHCVSMIEIKDEDDAFKKLSFLSS